MFLEIELADSPHPETVIAQLSAFSMFLFERALYKVNYDIQMILIKNVIKFKYMKLLKDL